MIIHLKKISLTHFGVYTTYLLIINKNQEKQVFIFYIYFWKLKQFGCTYNFGLHPESQQFGQR